MNSLRISHLSTQLLRNADFAFTSHASGLRRSPAIAAAFFHISRQRAQGPRPGRYGTAKPPPAHLTEGNAETTANDSESSKDAATIAATSEQKSSSTTQSPAAEEEFKALPSPNPSDSNTPLSSSKAKEEPSTTTTEAAGMSTPSLDRVLDVGSPNQPEHEKPPHLQAPKYVHHFDTWSLVKDLEKGGFTQVQTVTIMKAVRGLLADNMDLARKALVSKSNVENEMYLFKAACSELKTEIQNNRTAEADILRSQRAQLQHEVDILGQNLTQDAASVKDELKGLFDDRKMTVRVEQKQIESKVNQPIPFQTYIYIRTNDNQIQELNYKITVALNSDARGSVEGVRWLLTRRAGTALVISTLMVLGTLNYSRYMTQAQETERMNYAKELADAEEVSNTVRKGSSQGLAEEALLAPEGVGGG
jgi:Protein of unknown function (DUF1640)